jgi:hypothetical protein
MRITSIALMWALIATTFEHGQAQVHPEEGDAIAVGTCAVEDHTEEGVPFWVCVPVRGAREHEISVEFEHHDGSHWRGVDSVTSLWSQVAGSTMPRRRLAAGIQSATVEVLVDAARVMWTPGRWRVMGRATSLGDRVGQHGPWTEFDIRAEPRIRDMVSRSVGITIGSTPAEALRAHAILGVYENVWSPRAEILASKRLIGRDALPVLEEMERLANGDGASPKWRAYCRLRLANLWRGEAGIPADIAPNNPPRIELGNRVVAAADYATDLGAAWDLAREWERLMGLALRGELSRASAEPMLRNGLDARWFSGCEAMLKAQLPRRRADMFGSPTPQGGR